MRTHCCLAAIWLAQVAHGDESLAPVAQVVASVDAAFEDAWNRENVLLQLRPRTVHICVACTWISRGGFRLCQRYENSSRTVPLKSDLKLLMSCSIVPRSFGTSRLFCGTL